VLLLVGSLTEITGDVDPQRCNTPPMIHTWQENTVPAAKIPAPYVYRAEVLSVYDGDSITVMLDLGMGITRKAKCRLMGIDTPEIRTRSAIEKKAAYVARDRVRDLIGDQGVLLHSVAKPDKYGRLLVKVWTHEGTCINEVLIDEGLARAYDGGTKVSYASWT